MSPGRSISWRSINRTPCRLVVRVHGRIECEVDALVETSISEGPRADRAPDGITEYVTSHLEISADNNAQNVGNILTIFALFDYRQVK